MIVMLLILQMGITISRPVSKHVQPKINATVVSNLPPQMNSRHIRNNMLDRHGHVLSVIKKSKGNDKHAVYKHFRTQHKRRHLHQCTFDTYSVDGHPFGNDKQYMVWWHMQEDHGLHSPLGCPKCDRTYCSKQSQQKHIPTCPGKKDKYGPKQTPYAEKKFRCNECPKKYTTKAAVMQYKKVNKGTAKKYVCSLCGKVLSSTTALHRHEKIHEDN